MENRELLSAISDLLEEKLSPIKNELTTMKSDIAELKEDVAVLKEDVAVLKEEVAELKEDVAVLKEGQTRLELIIENEVRPDIKLLIDNFMPAAKKYEESSEKIEKMQSDITLMKSVIREHSEILQRLA